MRDLIDLSSLARNAFVPKEEEFSAYDTVEQIRAIIKGQLQTLQVDVTAEFDDCAHQSLIGD